MLLLSRWLLLCVVEWKEVSFRWVRVKMERESLVFILVYGQSREEGEMEGCCIDKNERVWSFGRNTW